MLSKRVVVCRQPLAFENLMKTRGISEFRLCDIRHWPGDDLQNRSYRRIWFNQHQRSSDRTREAPTKRLDETMYSPRLWREREYQSTWRESVPEEVELQEEVAKVEPRSQKPVPKATETVPQRGFDPKRRLQRVTIPAGEFFSKFISDQEKCKLKHYEAEVAADRLSNDDYQLA